MWWKICKLAEMSGGRHYSNTIWKQHRTEKNITIIFNEHIFFVQSLKLSSINYNNLSAFLKNTNKNLGAFEIISQKREYSWY